MCAGPWPCHECRRPELVAGSKLAGHDGSLETPAGVSGMMGVHPPLCPTGPQSTTGEWGGPLARNMKFVPFPKGFLCICF